MSLPPSFRFEADSDLPGSDRLGRLVFGIVRPLVDRLWDVTVEGIEHLPDTGPAIICPNHLSFSDSIFVPASLTRRAWAIGKGEYLDNWKTRYLFPALGMIPVDRSGGDAAAAALETAAAVLDRGHVFMIYPEGTRSRSGNLHKGRTGAARLANKCNAPILPVGHIGTLAVQPPDAVTMKTRLPVTVRIGEPLWARDFGDPDTDPLALRAMTDTLLYKISQLSGQTYVNTYAGSNDDPIVAPAKPVAVPTRPAGRTPSPFQPSEDDASAAPVGSRRRTDRDPARSGPPAVIDLATRRTASRVGRS